MRLFDIAVWGALVLWAVIQIIETFGATRETPVGYAAHLGGALAGLIFWSLNRGREPAGVLSIASRS